MEMGNAHGWESLLGSLLYAGGNTAQVDGFFLPSFSSSFASEIVLRILDGVNVGADTQQCLAILR